MATPRFRLLRSRRFWLLALAMVFAVGAAVALHAWWARDGLSPPANVQVMPAPANDLELAALLEAGPHEDVVPPVDPAAVRLIDRLVDVADEDVGTHSTAWAAAFLALDEDPQFAGGVLGSHPPAPNPAMRDLVRMGVAAVPALLEHLSDARKTRLVVGCKGIIEWARYSDEYGPRYRDRLRWPPGVNSGDRKRFTDGHTVCVGDLCYVALGQIVNRGMCAVRYQPTGGMVINSPIETPALAEAARKDWAGLTPAKHRRVLIADALSPWAVSALCRLCFYYPQAGEELAVRLLTGPRHDTEPARKFVVEQLLEEKQPERWPAMIEAFVMANGPTSAAMVRYLLDRICQESAYPRQTAKDRDVQDAARKVLAAVYPQHDPERPVFINAPAEHEKAAIIDALASVRGAKIDTAVATVFGSLDRTRQEWLDRVHTDDVALACMRRLTGKGMDAEFRGYCETRIRELEHKQQEPPEAERLEFLREALQRLPPERR